MSWHWLRVWPWRDPDPLPPVEGVDKAEALQRLARMRATETLAAVRRQRREVAANNFADDVREALGL